jgi:hypothetical protein
VILASIVHLAVMEAERQRDLERQQLVRAALAVRQTTRGRWPALTSALSFAPRRWFGQPDQAPALETSRGANLPACC